jgi:hypothetical protein
MVAGWLPQLLSLRYDVMPLQGPLMTTIAMKARLKRVAEKYPESTRVRLHRAFSRLGQAERESKDADAAVLFRCIAFTAAYARQLGLGPDACDPGLDARKSRT